MDRINLKDEGRLVYSNHHHIIVRLENLLNKFFMEVLSNLLKIKFKESMLEPTFRLWRKKVWGQNFRYKNSKTKMV